MPSRGLTVFRSHQLRWSGSGRGAISACVVGGQGYRRVCAGGIPVAAGPSPQPLSREGRRARTGVCRRQTMLRRCSAGCRVGPVGRLLPAADTCRGAGVLRLPPPARKRTDVDGHGHGPWRAMPPTLWAAVAHGLRPCTTYPRGRWPAGRLGAEGLQRPRAEPGRGRRSEPGRGCGVTGPSHVKPEKRGACRSEDSLRIESGGSGDVAHGPWPCTTYPRSRLARGVATPW